MGALRRQRGQIETDPASAWPAMDGAARTISSTSSTPALPVDTAPRSEPPLRRRRVTARVSMPCRPTTPCSASQSANPVRPAGTAFRPSRTITAPAAGCADSEAACSTP
jgi:hypothetical protein